MFARKKCIREAVGRSSQLVMAKPDGRISVSERRLAAAHSAVASALANWGSVSERRLAAAHSNGDVARLVGVSVSERRLAAAHS